MGVRVPSSAFFKQRKYKAGLFTHVVPKEQRWFTCSSILPRMTRKLVYDASRVPSSAFFLSPSLSEMAGVRVDYKQECNYISCYFP